MRRIRAVVLQNEKKKLMVREAGIIRLAFRRPAI